MNRGGELQTKARMRTGEGAMATNHVKEGRKGGRERELREVYLQCELPDSEGEVCFIARYICPHNPDTGLFILGPYCDEPRANGRITYRPKSSIPYLVTLLHKINVHEKHMRCPHQHRYSRCRYSLHVQKAIEYVHDRYHEKLSLCALARHLRLNKCYLSTIFREETGMTFSQYVNQIRIEKSKEYLRQSDISILDIALEVGFSNQNYFSTVFKKVTGMTPNEYRMIQAS